jgi:hypothetical protein
MIEAYTLAEVQKALSTLKEGAVIFIDVDDTLITPQSKIFRFLSPYRFLIADLKKNREKFPHFETIVSHWRLQRKTMRVSDAWPDLIKTLKEKYPVYALTQMESGSMGAISSLEKWRYEELAAKGISFTSSYKGVSEKVLLKGGSKTYPAVFYQGIFMTGSFHKSDVIRAFLHTQKPTQIVLIDDRKEMLEEVEIECRKHSLPFLAIHFKGVELIPGQPDPRVAEFQKHTLFKHAQWLEDEEAEQQLDCKLYRT